MRLKEPSGRQGWLQEHPDDHTLNESRRCPSDVKVAVVMSLLTGETTEGLFPSTGVSDCSDPCGGFGFAAHAGFEKQTCARAARATNSHPQELTHLGRLMFQRRSRAYPRPNASRPICRIGLFTEQNGPAKTLGVSVTANWSPAATGFVTTPLTLQLSR